jgi:hypothetical protein
VAALVRAIVVVRWVERPAGVGLLRGEDLGAGAQHVHAGGAIGLSGDSLPFADDPLQVALSGHFIASVLLKMGPSCWA